jgi:Ala-tRNA(Pro) deacylase
MPVKKLKEFLDRAGVKYVSIKHSPAYTALEIAQLTHIPGKELAKTVMLKLDGKMAMAVLPAADHVDVEQLARGAGAKRAQLATEGEFKNLFPECEIGGMPPFGNLYDMAVFVSPRLAEDVEITFNAGSHTELIKLAYKDFERLVHPKVISF